MIKAIIFDLDDTLISEEEYIISGYKHVSKFLSERVNLNEEEIYQQLMLLFSQSPVNVFNRFYDELNISYSSSDIMEIVELYRKHLPSIHFFNDVLLCIESLKNKSIKIGIITDGYAISQRQKLKAVHAYDYFEEIIITDELGRSFWKPHPLSFEEMRKKLNVEFNEMVYVGDNPQKDFYISALYPIRTVRINREKSIYLQKEYFKGTKENYLINSLNELLGVFY
jgi:putative hydrolase of the HAD superfamily